ncbi:MAG: ATPase, T2SS/T4P/T4SS family [Candidatus Micrarchaeaceae archaeon]
MENADFYKLELMILKRLKGQFVKIDKEKEREQLIIDIAKTIRPNVDAESLSTIIKDITSLRPIEGLINTETIEDVMVNNVQNIFVYDSKEGLIKVDVKLESKEELELLVEKLKLYATNEAANGNIYDVHLPNGSRANIVSSPLGYDITIRNFKSTTLSILDLINYNELDYQIAARLWIYTDGFKVRPANLIIGGMPAAGKTTLLNSMFSFFRPEQRIVTIEETYELNTKTMENCVNLETSDDLPMIELVKNALRMRPDMLIIGEVRGSEANDMITAMNVGKIGMTTIHAPAARDVINRLEHFPMNVPQDIIPVIDAIIIVGQVYSKNKPTRKIIQISEIAGIETQILLSDLYRFDYKTGKGLPILPSVTYRDTLSNLLGIPPSDILAEENVRANILYAMNKLGMRDIVSINNIVKDYYDNPEATLKKLGLNLEPIIKV